ncbi:hypothetical protein KCU83_g643, partial [Aureobasidium melanogenum]
MVRVHVSGVDQLKASILVEKFSCLPFSILKLFSLAYLLLIQSLFPTSMNILSSPALFSTDILQVCSLVYKMLQTTPGEFVSDILPFLLRKSLLYAPLRG